MAHAAQTRHEAGTLPEAGQDNAPPLSTQPAAAPVVIDISGLAPSEGRPAGPTGEGVASEGVADPFAAALEAKAASLASGVEALLISSPRAIPPRRLGQALGLIAPDEPPPESGTTVAAPGAEISPPDGDSSASASAPESAPAPAKPKRAVRRRKGASGELDPEAVISRAVALLNQAYEQTGRSFRVETVAGGYRFMTLPQHGPAIAALHGVTAHAKLSRPAIETLAIIAYRQPVTRAQLEAIRGVACGEVVKTLLDRRLITIAGRAEELGRPLLYATTKQFLAAFGLSSIKDLPAPGEVGLTLSRGG